MQLVRSEHNGGTLSAAPNRPTGTPTEAHEHGHGPVLPGGRRAARTSRYDGSRVSDTMNYTGVGAGVPSADGGMSAQPIKPPLAIDSAHDQHERAPDHASNAVRHTDGVPG